MLPETPENAQRPWAASMASDERGMRRPDIDAHAAGCRVHVNWMYEDAITRGGL